MGGTITYKNANLWCVRLTGVCVAGDLVTGESPSWSKGSHPSSSPRVMCLSSQRGLGEVPAVADSVRATRPTESVIIWASEAVIVACGSNYSGDVVVGSIVPTASKNP